MARRAAPGGAGAEGDKKDMDFETALGQLEGIVSELESGRLGLEESLARFDEAMKLREFCARKLREAEAKIEEYTARAEAANSAHEIDDEIFDMDAVGCEGATEAEDEGDVGDATQGRLLGGAE
ncbi:MAG: exodeoxyribonuclease VII small subunit [Armatimonadetes bacterium]|nr:exodeoxyribonuclease VII small subunit [Armatimonadota bacterium]